MQRTEPDGSRRKRAAVLRRDRCAGWAIIGRAVGGLLAEGRNADAAVDPALAQLGLLLAQRFVIHEADELVEAFMEGHGFQSLAAGRDAGQRGFRPVVAALELDRVDAESVGREIGQELRRRCRRSGMPTPRYMPIKFLLT